MRDRHGSGIDHNSSDVHLTGCTWVVEEGQYKRRESPVYMTLLTDALSLRHAISNAGFLSRHGDRNLLLQPGQFPHHGGAAGSLSKALIHPAGDPDVGSLRWSRRRADYPRPGWRAGEMEAGEMEAVYGDAQSFQRQGLGRCGFGLLRSYPVRCTALM